jgi:peptidoglycan-N-acetylglucosamine deacetylase
MTGGDMTTSLDDELAALSKAVEDHDARLQVIEACDWPAGARIAVNVTADFDTMLLRRLLNEPALQLAKGEFGGRVGIWRLLELFGSHDIQATVFTPGRICELYPDAVRAIAAEGHEVADHMWEHRVPAERALEEEHLRLALDALERLTGRRPVGTRSWHTPSVLRNAGIVYNSHGVYDHRPHWIRDPDTSAPNSGANGAASGARMLNLPFHYTIDDAMYYSFTWLNTENSAQRISDPERVEALWWDAFRQQYEVGGYLNICLHPFVSGRAQRIAMLDRLFTRMKRLPGVWFPSCEAVARHLIGVAV